MKRLILWLGLVAVVGAVIGPSALAAKPTLERVEVSDLGVADPFLSDACGVPVTLDIVGHVIIRTFDGSGGPEQVLTLNLELTAHAGDNVYRMRDVGADIVRVAPDGTVILMIVGQVPFGFTGVLKLNPETGEAILEPQHSLEDRVDDACAALTA
ncbi:MAG: hypothetical protein K0T00_665 [Gaiellaceae bacterium]|nr:hypothetical protein [Gaiellaceae bacterium]